MYSCILVVGSGMKFQGIGMWLHNRISLQIPYMYRAGEVIPNSSRLCFYPYNNFRATGHHNASEGNGSRNDGVERSGDIIVPRVRSRVVDRSSRVGANWRQSIAREGSVYVVKAGCSCWRRFIIIETSFSNLIGIRTWSEHKVEDSALSLGLPIRKECDRHRLHEPSLSRTFSKLTLEHNFCMKYIYYKPFVFFVLFFTLSRLITDRRVLLSLCRKDDAW